MYCSLNGLKIILTLGIIITKIMIFKIFRWIATKMWYIYDYGAFTLNGKKEHIQFKQYAGKHVLFVNVATYCGLTAQYPGKVHS